MRLRPVSLAVLLAVIAPAAPVWAQAPAAQASAAAGAAQAWVLVGDASVVKPQLGALGLPLEVRTTR